MANPVIKVILSAVDEVSGVAKKASDGIAGFAEKAKGALSALGALGVGVALGNFFKGAIEEGAKAEVGMGRLATSVRNAGGNFEALKPQLESTIASVQRMSTATDDELREALTRLIAVSGDVAGSQENLSLVADIAAYKQISLTDAAELVGKAMNGNVTSLNKMGIAGKDATTVLENARASFGGFAKNEASTFSGTLKLISNLWGDFQEAVGTALLSSGQMGESATGLAGAMAGLAGWVEANEGQIRLFTNAIGNTVGALFEVARTLFETVRPQLTFLLKVVGGALLVELNNLSYVVKALAAAFQYGSGKSLEAIGYLVEKGGALLKLFGVQVVAEAGTSIRHFGETLVASSKESIAKSNAVWKQGMDDLLKGRADAGAKTVTIEQGTGNAVNDEVEKQTKKRQDTEDKAAKARLEQDRKVHEATLKGLVDANKQLADEMAKRHADTRAAVDQLSDLITGKLGSETAYALGLTSRAMEQLLVALRGHIPSDEWDRLNSAVQQHKRDLSDLLPPASSLAEAAKDAEAANKRYGEELKSAKKSTTDLVRDSAGLARAFVDAASATGIIDDKMANILNASISLATNIGKAFGGDPTAIAASVTSLANIIVGIGSSEVERKRQAAAASNTLALDRLTREVGNLNLRESGKTFAGIQSAVDASIQARADARASGKGPGDADKAAKEAFLKSLASQGIGLEEARALFKELFGRDLALANAGTFFQDIQAFSEGLQNTEFGQFGKDFEGQLDALTRGFEILGITDADDKLQKFRTLVGKFSPALADALNVDLSTPEGIAKATENLRALFGKLESGGLSPTEIGVSGGQFVKLIETILPLLGDANGTLGSGLAASVSSGPVIGASPASASAAFASSAALLGAPGLPTPSLGPYAGAGLGVAPSGGTVINGYSPSFVFNVSPVDGEDAATFSRRLAADVDSLLVFRLDSLTAAAGKITQVGT